MRRNPFLARLLFRFVSLGAAASVYQAAAQQSAAAAVTSVKQIEAKGSLADVLCPARPSLKDVGEAVLRRSLNVTSAPSDQEFYLASLLAGLAYAPGAAESQLLAAGFGDYFSIENTASGFAGFLVGSGERAFLAIAGTVDVLDVVTDLRFVPVAESSGRIPGRVHSGFQAQLDSVWPRVSELLASNAYRNRSVTIVGHSLGAALATLVAARLEVSGFAIDRVLALASPRVGDSDFSSWYEGAWGANLGARTFRYSKGDDIVPRVPPDFRDAEAFAAVFPDSAAPQLSKIVASFRYEHVAGTAHFENIWERANQLPRLPLVSGDLAYWQWLEGKIAAGQPIWTVVSGAAVVLDHQIDQFVCYGANMLESSTVR